MQLGVSSEADDVELELESDSDSEEAKTAAASIAGVRRAESLGVTLFKVPIDYGKMKIN
jgi:hypothetical protein